MGGQSTRRRRSRENGIKEDLKSTQTVVLDKERRRHEENGEGGSYPVLLIDMKEESPNCQQPPDSSPSLARFILSASLPPKWEPFSSLCLSHQFSLSPVALNMMSRWPLTGPEIGHHPTGSQAFCVCVAWGYLSQQILLLTSHLTFFMAKSQGHLGTYK